MSFSKTHTDLAAERARMLEDALPLLFKGDTAPPVQLIRNIAAHLAIGKRPDMLQNPRAVKADSAKIFDKYGPTLEVVHDSTALVRTLCPISQSPVAVPWVSTCGHTFEEHVVLGYIGKGSAKQRKKDPSFDIMSISVSCPVIGCGKPLARKEDRA